MLYRFNKLNSNSKHHREPAIRYANIWAEKHLFCLGICNCPCSYSNDLKEFHRLLNFLALFAENNLSKVKHIIFSTVYYWTVFIFSRIT